MLRTSGSSGPSTRWQSGTRFREEPCGACLVPVVPAPVGELVPGAQRLPVVGARVLQLLDEQFFKTLHSSTGVRRLAPPAGKLEPGLLA